MSFEGPEKKLQVDFAGEASLRRVQRADWERVCAAVRCAILSHAHNAHFDAYVLSESSLFVYPRRVVVKTCGTTTLLACLEPLLAIAADLGLAAVAVYYSRQRFIFPEKQPFPHTSFEHETAHLNARFPAGESHCLGDQGGDHWFLYHAASADRVVPRRDRTLEVMMRDLDPAVMRLFYLATYDAPATLHAAIVAAFGADSATTRRLVAAADAGRAAGLAPRALAAACVRSLLSIDTLFPGVQLDDHVFEPCGYSVNGLLNGTYLTMHFTPEPTHSFVSFDTNCTSVGPHAVLAWLGHVLRPGRMAIALASDGAAAASPAAAKTRRSVNLSADNYARTVSTRVEFFAPLTDEPTYDVLYTHLRRTESLAFH